MADKALHGTVLVIDDIYGAVSKETKNKPYDRTNFKSDFGKLPFRFVFSTAWDEAAGGYTVEEAIRAVEKEKIDGVLLDITFGKNHEDRLGLAILRELTARFPALPVIMMTSVARNETWEECARLGAVDYLPKPLDARLLWQTLDRYVGVEPKYWLIGQNSLFLEAINLAAMASEGGETAVMITGETGTGKELLARFLHRHGKRSSKSLEIIFLPNIPDELQADYLFGHSKGAFDGARDNSPGRFLAADGGVVFLDEIGDINRDTQTRLLRVADSGEVARLGDGKTSHVDVQLITATNANLAQKIKTGGFRFDLWARLNGMHVTLPALAQRPDDILLLVRHMLRCRALQRDRPVPPLPQRIESALRDFSWLTNVRGPQKYAQLVFDLARDAPPDEAVFFTALDKIAKELSTLVAETSAAQSPPPAVGRNQPVEAPTEQPPPTMGVQAYPIAGALSPAEQIQQCRLAEFAVLHRLYEQTRHPVTGKKDRKVAASLLLGKSEVLANSESEVETNVFDRPVIKIWNTLTPESRERAVRQFPALAQLAQKLIERKRNKPKRSRESGS